jgi:hypothetical protein
VQAAYSQASCAERSQLAKPNDSDALSAEARAQLLDFWQRRADGEWTTAAALQHVFDDLVVLGAPAALRDLVTVAIADEHRHTTWCAEAARELGGSDFRPSVLGHRPFALQGASEAENRLLRVIFAGCIGETIAIHVLRESHAELERGPVREVNRLHMSEEVNHARVGWAFLNWAKERGLLHAAARQSIQNALPSLLELSSSAWLTGGRAVTPDLRRRGFIDSIHIERGLARAFEEVIRPGFERFDLCLAVTEWNYGCRV